MTDKTICRNDGRCEYAIQIGAEKEGSCPAGKCAMPCDTASHLTIPGALEWDGDNGTHGVVGTHSADGESAANIKRALAGMLFAFDDGVGQDWSKDLLDFARKLVGAEEFKSDSPQAAFDDIPDFTPCSGNKAKRRIAAIEKAKQKTCIECDQPYCHGVCVERGDQGYDRDQAAKGGDDE